MMGPLDGGPQPSLGVLSANVARKGSQSRTGALSAQALAAAAEKKRLHDQAMAAYYHNYQQQNQRQSSPEPTMAQQAAQSTVDATQAHPGWLAQLYARITGQDQ